MKTLILFTAAIYLTIAIPESKAGVAGIITYLKGECNEPDEKGVRRCSSSTDGKIYYVYKGERHENYPVFK